MSHLLPEVPRSLREIHDACSSPRNHGPSRGRSVGNAAASDEPRRTPNIWVLDDDAVLRRALGRLLRATGFAVRTFASPDEMLAHARSSVPDCLILDVHLGTVTGFDVQDRVRSSGAAVPVIFITGHDDAATREQARQVGAAGYVPKPFNDTDLLTAIDAVVPR